MRYYESHEFAYKQLKRDGEVCWGRDDFENVFMLPFLKFALQRLGYDAGESRRCLVVGCGTGPLACELTRRGFEVHGIDVSATAIEMARENAKARALEITYRVGDLCTDPLESAHYDLIIDSHCLHCIVGQEHRDAALSSIRAALKPDGFFILETMLGVPDSLRGGVDVDEEGVFWFSLKEEDGLRFENATLKDGFWRIPQRFFQADKAAMDLELVRNGFVVSWSRQTREEVGEGCDYQGICHSA